MNSVRAKQAKIGGALGIILAAQLFLFMPFTLYLGNAGEFTVPFGAAAGVWLPLALLLAVILTLIAVLLPGPQCPAYLCVVATVSILVWVQGNLLVWDYGPLDGRDIEWDAYALRGWLDIAVWLGALTAAVVAYRRLDKPIIRTAMVLFLLQAVLFAYTLIQYAADVSDESESAGTAPIEKIMQFSSQKNVLHIIGDGLQADIFDELTKESASGERLRTALDGFSFFRAHLGVFPYTHMTIPAFLSSKIYQNHLPIEDFMASTVGGKNILSVASDAGYEVDLAVPSGALSKIYSKSRSTNFYPISSQHLSASIDPNYNAAAILLDLTLFRVMPHLVKKHVYNDQLWLVQSLISDNKYMRLAFFSHSLFLDRMAKQISADRSEPVYKLIHVMLSHKPMVATEQCIYAGRVLPTVRETVKNQARCGLKEVVKLLESMKRLDIYDDATIVIMGDHGAWVPPMGGTAIVNADGKTADYIHPHVIALSIPLLAVKRPGDSGPLKLSDARSWIVDTAATIADAAGIDAQFDGKSVFDLNGNESRQRRFYIYEYNKSELTDDYLAPIEEFAINGSPVDSASWRYVVTHHPGGRAERSRVKSAAWQTVTLQ